MIPLRDEFLSDEDLVLWAGIEHRGPSTSRYSPKRIRISMEPGDKYADTSLDPLRPRPSHHV